MSKEKTAGPDLRTGIPAADCADGNLVTGTVDGKPVVITRHSGQLCALSATCTHLGAPLGKGIVIDGELRCPWHHARFDVTSGEAVGAPAFEALTRYAVSVSDGVIKVADALPARSPAKAVEKSEDRFVIVGAGAAGHACAELLARRGYGAQVTIVDAEADAPYDRTFCSKQYLAGKKSREDCAMPAMGTGVTAVKPNTQRRAIAINTAARQLNLADGTSLPYSALILATGAEPIAPDFAGADHARVHLLRTLMDADAVIASATSAKHAAVIGASFIGLEAAASLRARGLSVTVIAPEEIPLASKLGNAVGGFVQKLHEGKQVQFRMGRKVMGYDGFHLTLDDGSSIEAELVIVGLGVKPRTELAEAAGIKLASKEEGGGVRVDEHLQTSVPGIYAIGDIANYPEARLGQSIRVEHWVHAQRQGQFLARLLMGEAVRYTDTPFFWSGHYDQSLRYLGRGSAKRLDVQGNIEQVDFALDYLGKDDSEQALLTCGRDVESLNREALWDEAAKVVTETTRRS